MVIAPTCRVAVQAASDHLAGLSPDTGRGPFEAHLAGCASCACLMDQLRTTVAVLGSGRPATLAAQLPSLYRLATSLDPGAADDLVQETLTAALADPDADRTAAGLAEALVRLAARGGPELGSPAIPTPGSDPDADEAELFYPDFYTDGPDAGAWVDPPVAWGATRVLGPDDELLIADAYGAVDGALGRLDPVDRRLITLVDIEGTPFDRAAVELDVAPAEARKRLARARFAVRAALDRHLRT